MLKSMPSLLLENGKYGDIIFRDSCDVMKRHPEYINYGNSPPVGDNLFRINRTFNGSLYQHNETSKVLNPDYHLRRMYKIDWKVCFLKWALKNDKMAEYHVFVEDDSFICSENLIHQANILFNRSNSKGSSLQSFRAGTSMYDGFDDSSTLMTKNIAMAFAEHYFENGFNCSGVVDRAADDPQSDSLWLSWGNSWMSSKCNWRKALQTRLNIQMIKPLIACSVGSTSKDSDGHTQLSFPCMSEPLILHHWKAATLLLEKTAPSSKVTHLCEYMLLVDKVKDVGDMFDLWNRLTANNYHDFSEVFLHEDETGWRKTLQLLMDEEIECRRQYQHQQTPASSSCIFEIDFNNGSLKLDKNRNGRRVMSTKFSDFHPSRFYFSKAFDL